MPHQSLLCTTLGASEQAQGPACSTAYTKALRGPTGLKTTTATLSSPKAAAEPPSPSPSFWLAINQNSLCRTNRGKSRLRQSSAVPRHAAFSSQAVFTLRNLNHSNPRQQPAPTTTAQTAARCSTTPAWRQPWLRGSKEEPRPGARCSASPQSS